MGCFEMTKKQLVFALASCMGMAAIASAAQASDVKTWYIYCEAKVDGKQSTIFSTNLWPHEASGTYRSALASAAESYIAGGSNMEMAGCAGIPFIDQTIAEYNRARTAELALGIGDSVYYVELPARVLPD